MRYVQRLILITMMLITALCSGLATAASPTCENSGFMEGRAITDLCWDCFFPIQIIGIPIGFGSRGSNMLPDDTAAPVCVCPGKFFGVPSFGLTLGYWSPEHLIETVRNPWCSPMLGTSLISNSTSTFNGIMGKVQLGSWSAANDASGDDASQAGFYNFHWIKFPGGLLVDELMDSVCSPRGDFDIDYAYMSEIDPTWQSDVLSMYTAPEGHIFSQMYAHLACIADGIAATVRKPIFGAYWCAGTWGQVYPMDGKLPLGGAYASQMLTAVKGQAHMHRLGLAKLSYGDTAVCADSFWFILPHEQYQYQNFWPVADRSHAVWAGTSQYWNGSGISRDIPVVGEDRLIMAWQFRNCCMTFW